MSNKVFPTPLSEAFFSPFNREYLHGAIVRNVRTKTGMSIDRQSDADLQALMRSVYNHMYGQLEKSEVSKLNEIVVREATKTISTGILQQLSYMNYISENPVPLSRAISTSTAGMKLPSQNPAV